MTRDTYDPSTETYQEMNARHAEAKAELHAAQSRLKAAHAAERAMWYAHARAKKDEARTSKDQSKNLRRKVSEIAADLRAHAGQQGFAPTYSADHARQALTVCTTVPSDEAGYCALMDTIHDLFTAAGLTLEGPRY